MSLMLDPNGPWDVILELVSCNSLTAKEFIASEHRFNGPSCPPTPTPYQREASRESREGTEEPDRNSSITLRFSRPPLNHLNYVIGSGRKADVQIGISALGKSTSSAQLLVDFDDEGQVILKDTSSHSTIFQYGNNRAFHSAGDRNNPPRWVIPPEMPVTVSSYDFSFVVKTQDHRDHKQQFLQSLNAFRQDLEFVADIEPVMPTLLPNLTSKPHTQRYGYVSVSELGEGGFGKVYKMIRTDTWKLVAGKTTGTKENPKFMEEVNILKELAHENIIKYLDFYKHELGQMLIMEFCELGTLGDEIQAHSSNGKNNFPFEKAVMVVEQTAKALEYLHGRRVVHRDLKPENILIKSREPFVIAVSDFGLARVLDRSVMGSQLGTPGYKAPEFYEYGSDGNINYTNSVDIWALGVVAIRCLVNGLPKPYEYKETDYHRALVKLKDKTLAGFKSGPQLKWKETVDCMLVVDRSKRCTAQQCRTNIGAALAMMFGNTTTAQAPTPAQDSIKYRLRNYTTLHLAGASTTPRPPTAASAATLRQQPPIPSDCLGLSKSTTKGEVAPKHLPQSRAAQPSVSVEFCAPGDSFDIPGRPTSFGADSTSTANHTDHPVVPGSQSAGAQAAAARNNPARLQPPRPAATGYRAARPASLQKVVKSASRGNRPISSAEVARLEDYVFADKDKGMLVVKKTDGRD